MIGFRKIFFKTCNFHETNGPVDRRSFNMGKITKKILNILHLYQFNPKPFLIWLIWSFHYLLMFGHKCQLFYVASPASVLTLTIVVIFFKKLNFKIFKVIYFFSFLLFRLLWPMRVVSPATKQGPPHPGPRGKPSSSPSLAIGKKEKKGKKEKF